MLLRPVMVAQPVILVQMVMGITAQQEQQGTMELPATPA
jgi:hypothetical protein